MLNIALTKYTLVRPVHWVQILSLSILDLAKYSGEEIAKGNVIVRNYLRSPITKTSMQSELTMK